MGQVKHDATFQTEGYRNWSQALQNGKGFDKHSKSDCHIKNMERWSNFGRTVPIDAQLALERKRQLEIGTKEWQQRQEI